MGILGKVIFFHRNLQLIFYFKTNTSSGNS
nr:MAG TPA: hypothetical protein [Caudoviricetes sp.]